MELGSPGPELLCSEPDGKSEQGLSKQHSPLLGICKRASPKRNAESVRSALAANLEQSGERPGEEGKDAGEHVARV